MNVSKRSRRLTRSNFIGPVNIGSEEMATIDQLVYMVTEIAGKKIRIRHVPRAGGVLTEGCVSILLSGHRLYKLVVATASS